MKFLCLPGAFGNAKNFKVQLGPFVSELERNSDLSFEWTEGTNRAYPPAGFEDYFGPGPLYRFIDFDGLDGFDDLLEQIRDFPEGISAEDTMRLLIGERTPYTEANLQKTLQALFDIIDRDDEIEGILGYSEGATTAASLILEERRRFEEQGMPRRIKAAIFLAGWPPLTVENGMVHPLLADECEDVIDIPSCHVVGCDDPYIHGAMALYNLCDEDSAELFDHGKGHTVPRDRATLKELGEAVRRLTARAAAEGGRFIA